MALSPAEQTAIDALRDLRQKQRAFDAAQQAALDARAAADAAQEALRLARVYLDSLLDS